MPSPSTPPAAQVAAQILDLAHHASQADGVEPIGEQTLLDVHSAADHGRELPALVRWENQTLVAAAAWPQTEAGLPGRSVEMVVHPQHRRRGIGGALLAELLGQDPSLRVWAHGNLAGALATAARAGLHVVRELWQMRLDVPQASDASSAPSADLPAGFAARAFVPGQDEQDWLTVNARAFAAHPEQGRMSLADLREREALPWFDPQGLILVHEQRTGRLAASHWTKAPSPQEAEVYVVAVDPDYQGRGLAAPVTALGLRHLMQRGARAISLYVESDNDRAVATYRRHGFTRSAVHAMYAR